MQSLFDNNDIVSFTETWLSTLYSLNIFLIFPYIHKHFKLQHINSW